MHVEWSQELSNADDIVAVAGLITRVVDRSSCFTMSM